MLRTHEKIKHLFIKIKAFILHWKVFFPFYKNQTKHLLQTHHNDKEILKIIFQSLLLKSSNLAKTVQTSKVGCCNTDIKYFI